MYFKPETVNVYARMVPVGGLAAVLPLFAVIGRQDQRAARAPAHEQRGAPLGSRQRCVRSPTHDHLTGLPTGVIVQRGAPARARQAERHARPVALFFMDLDRFKNINDTLGHQFGDRVLAGCRQAPAAAVREATSSRASAETSSCWLVEEQGDPAALTEIARKLLAAVSELRKIDGHELNVTLSIGICTYPADGRDFEDAAVRGGYRHVPRQGSGPQRIQLLFRRAAIAHAGEARAGGRPAARPRAGEFACTTSPRST